MALHPEVVQKFRVTVMVGRDNSPPSVATRSPCVGSPETAVPISIFPIDRVDLLELGFRPSQFGGSGRTALWITRFGDAPSGTRWPVHAI